MTIPTEWRCRLAAFSTWQAWQKLKPLAAWRPPAADSLGLFLERENLTLVGVRRSWQGVEVTLTASFPRPETGESKLPDELRAWVASYQLQDCPTGLVVAEDLGFCRHLSLPAAAADDLAQVLAYEMDRFLPLAAEELYFTYQISERGEKEVKFFLLAVPRNLVAPSLAWAREAGLKVVALDLPVTAALNAFTKLAGKLPRSWWLLQSEDQYRALYQIRRGQLVGLRRLTPAALSSGEWLKELELETSAPAALKPVEPQTLCLVGDLTGLEQRTFNWQPERVAVVDHQRLAVKAAIPISLPSRILVPALGAAQRGLGRLAWRGNLLPETDRDPVQFSNLLLTRFLLLSLVVLLGLWSISALIHKRVTLSRLSQQVAALQPQINEIKREMSDSQRMVQALEELWGSEAQKFKKLAILKKLTEIIPDHTWLYALRLGPKSIEMSGYSRSAADLIPIIEKSGFFTKTEFSSPIVTDGKGNENFTLRTELKTVD